MVACRLLDGPQKQTTMKRGYAVCGLVVLAVWLTTPLPEAAMEPQSPRQEVESIIKVSWANIKSGLPAPRSFNEFVSWDYAIAPAIPAAWPPDGKGVVYYYTFAYGSNPARLVDGQFVAAPWAQVKVDVARGAPELEILSKGIKEIGIQGVRPLREEEIKIFNQRAAVEEQIQTLSRKTSLHAIDAKRLKEFFQLWCSTNGVIAEELRRKHPQFFEWVGCK